MKSNPPRNYAWAFSRPRRGFRPTTAFGLAWLLILVLVQQAHAQSTVDEILSRAEPPGGVVFEIVEGREAALATLMPRVRQHVARLRARFPGLEIALVAHGAEQFALQTSRQDVFPELHALTETLVADDVPIHVCGTHAGWRGISAEDFPDYVDVTPAGPAQINQYLELDYELVVIDLAD